MKNLITLLVRLFIWLYVLVVELLAILLCSLLYFFRSSRLDLPSEEGTTKLQVVCVHGYLHNETGWSFFRWYLRASGIGSVNTVYYPSLSQGIPANSLKIKEKVQEIYEKTGKSVDVLIGHSLGGIQCLEYALEHAPKDKIIHVVTLGSPLYGTKVSLGIGESAKQMQWLSPYIQDLHERLQKAKHIRLLTLGSKTDQLIIPSSSALVTDSAQVEWEEFDALGHLSFLFSRRVLKRILRHLHNIKKSS